MATTYDLSDQLIALKQRAIVAKAGVDQKGCGSLWLQLADASRRAGKPTQWGYRHSAIGLTSNRVDIAFID
ncbi:hypothetical protein EER27_05780 [Lysobacter psychrotolerans]|uniref:Uncharacterized protein n=1 Tax=Montanilutibacter psychrotolerans TaxID=1327343 RepID=A0A3M8SWS9_9GAMM|nr:hypothetical protein EER27_05780 [Lysobacter psychrotolerans]